MSKQKKKALQQIVDEKMDEITNAIKTKRDYENIQPGFRDNFDIQSRVETREYNKP